MSAARRAAAPRKASLSGRRSTGRAVLACLVLVAAAPLAPIAAARSRGSLSVAVTDRSGRPLADAGVWVRARGAKLPPAPRKVVSIEQKDREFIPLVSVVQTGTRVAFPNRDQLLHHVYSFSPAKRFEFKLYEGDPPEPVLLDRPGVISVGCNIHDWMQAFVLVVDTPHFARTDAQGRATLAGLAPGSYELQVWHPYQKAGAAPQTLRIPGASAARVELEVYAPRRRPKPPPGTHSYGR